MNPVPVKRLDLLIRSFEVATRTHRDWNLLLVGDGPERPQMEELVVGLGLADRVRITGFVDDPATHIADADVAFFSTWCPAGTSIETLVRVEGQPPA